MGSIGLRQLDDILLVKAKLPSFFLVVTSKYFIQVHTKPANYSIVLKFHQVSFENELFQIISSYNLNNKYAVNLTVSIQCVS